jgi:small subunit ribosomal protein S13
MEQKEYRHIVRVVNTDLDGSKAIMQALRKIKGIGAMYASMVCTLANVDKSKKTGTLTDAEVAKLDDVIKSPAKYHVPTWMMNRRKDVENGEDMHLITSNLDFYTDNDIKIMRKIKSYKGVRHSLGQPVRGQRTKSNFRRNKGKVMGVTKTKVAAPAADKGKDKK